MRGRPRLYQSAQKIWQIETLGNTLVEAHNHLKKTAKTEKIVLVINTKKKEIMRGNSRKENPIGSNNEDIKLADDFIYLG